MKNYLYFISPDVWQVVCVAKALAIEGGVNFINITGTTLTSKVILFVFFLSMKCFQLFLLHIVIC
jgi:hypothetical protein